MKFLSFFFFVFAIFAYVSAEECPPCNEEFVASEGACSCTVGRKFNFQGEGFCCFDPKSQKDDSSE
jgi:hypothetical protein